MKLSLETRASMEVDIEAEVERRIRDYPIKVFVADREIYIDEVLIDGGECWLKIDDKIGYVED